MSAQGVDYSFSRPNPGQLHAAGYTFACRYLTGDGKAITVQEYQALRNAGLAVVVVYEAGAANALGGMAQGAIDGMHANLAADALGWPKDRPIYYAVDFDDRGHPGSLGLIVQYLTAAQQKGRAARVYGSIRVVDAWGKPGWQTAAWSGSAISPNAAIYQHAFQVPFHGSAVDINDARMDDYGQVPYAQPKPLPPPPPPHTVDLGDKPVQITDTSINVDGQGNGYFDLPGVSDPEVLGVFVIGLQDPQGHGYPTVPVTYYTLHNGTSRVVVRGAAPSSRVSVRVTHT